MRGNPRAAQLHEQFVVDVIQGGAGTSTNMNANEVIANRALELLGHAARRVRSSCIPNEHVNLSQSTNDVYPDGAEDRAALRHRRGWSTRWTCCAARSSARREEFSDVLKMGRTQLQDAVPMTLGQEFTTYAVMLGEDEERLQAKRALLIREINLGATAIGTGINAHPDYAALVCRHLSRHHRHRRSSPSPNLVEATQDCGAFVQLSGVLKRVAVKLSKTCNDLRLLSCGPRAGLRRDQPAADAGRLVASCRAR